jgi:hypothetical protein
VPFKEVDNEMDEEEEDEEEDEFDPNANPSNWRTVRDPETGEIYWNNKVSGDTVYEDPFEGQVSCCCIRVLSVRIDSRAICVKILPPKEGMPYNLGSHRYTTKKGVRHALLAPGLVVL